MRYNRTRSRSRINTGVSLISSKLSAWNSCDCQPNIQERGRSKPSDENRRYVCFDSSATKPNGTRLPFGFFLLRQAMVQMVSWISYLLNAKYFYIKLKQGGYQRWSKAYWFMTCLPEEWTSVSAWRNITVGSLWHHNGGLDPEPMDPYQNWDGRGLVFGRNQNGYLDWVESPNLICEKRKRKQNILQHEANCSQIASCPLMQNEIVQALAKIR